MFTPALFTTAKVQKQHKRPSMSEWIKKLEYIYTMEYYSAIKKNEILPFVTQMDLEGNKLEKKKKEEKKIYVYLCVHTCMNLNKYICIYVYTYMALNTI